MINTYLINGFMDAGKTSFIKKMLEQEHFQTGETTLILLCKDGDEEFDEAYCRENKEDFEPSYITEFEKKNKPTRVIVEFNGMWERGNTQFPWYWDAPIEIRRLDIFVCSCGEGLCSKI